MAKYIDADALVQKIVITPTHALDDIAFWHGDALTGLANRQNEIIDMIDKMPPADVAPVVRCKDCKHCRNLPHGMCYLNTEPYDNERGYKGEAVCVEADDFCSYGEKAR